MGLNSKLSETNSGGAQSASGGAERSSCSTSLLGAKKHTPENPGRACKPLFADTRLRALPAKDYGHSGSGKKVLETAPGIKAGML